MHISLDSALGRQRRLNSVGESLLQISPNASIALSLRSLTGGDPLVVRVRRSSDNLEQDFTASEVSSGALVDFVNGNWENVLYSTFVNGESWQNGFTAVNTGSSAAGLQIPSGVSGDTITITVDVTFDSGSPSPSFSLRDATGGNVRSDVVFVTSEGSHTITLTANGNFSHIVIGEGDSPSGFTISNVVLSVVPTPLYDGFVRTWYDQAGSKNATQTNISNQPKIVENGSLITETRSGVTTAAIKFTSDSGTPANSNFLQTSSNYLNTSDGAITTCLVVPAQNNTDKGILGKNNSNNRVGINANSNNGYRFNMPASRVYRNNGTAQGDVDLYFNVVVGTTANTDDECFRNNTKLDNNSGTVPSVGASMNQIGARKGGTSSAVGTDGNYQEVIIYTSDLRSDGANIRRNITSHYSLTDD